MVSLAFSAPIPGGVLSPGILIGAAVVRPCPRLCASLNQIRSLLVHAYVLLCIHSQGRALAILINATLGAASVNTGVYALYGAGAMLGTKASLASQDALTARVNRWLLAVGHARGRASDGSHR